VPRFHRERAGLETPPAQLGRAVIPTILVVEDNPDNMKLFAWTLEDEGLPFEGVGTAEEARAALERRPFDLVLMDISLLGWTGRGLRGDSAPSPPCPSEGDRTDGRLDRPPHVPTLEPDRPSPACQGHVSPAGRDGPARGLPEEKKCPST
jgi:Response regulator receiver domain